jgi:hypothetical protein
MKTAAAAADAASAGRTAPAHVREYRYAIATVAILAAMLLVVGALTLQTWRTARTHERAVTAALRSYAGVAATLYRERFEALVTFALTPLRLIASSRAVASAAALPSAGVVHDSIAAVVACKCRTVLAPNYVFRIDLRDSSFQAAGDSTVSRELQRWIVAALPAALEEYQRSQTYGALTGTVAGRPRIVYFSVRRNAAGEPVAAYGMEPSARALDSVIFDGALKETSLQRFILSDSLPNDSIISVAATFPSGELAHRSKNAFESPYGGRETISAQGGAFRLDVTLNPAAVSRLIVGGVPRSQLPLLVVLLGITAGLVVAAIVLTWRTWSLARLRADFTSSVSHELRTPITQIMLFAETIALGQEGRRLLDLIENVLHFARSERYELPINRQMTNLTALVREATGVFEPVASAAGVRLRTTLEPDVGARIDGPAVQRSLRNVLDNAVKYAVSGGEAHVWLVLSGARASIWVDDHGPGVPSGDRERVWQAFVRLERDMNQATGGSGIGLAVVRDVVVRHGGSVRVEDAPGGGARFVLEFPDACRLGPRAVQETAARDISSRAAEL